MSDNAQLTGLCDRFRGFYPVVIDVETAGFNAKTDALLEIAAITLKMGAAFFGYGFAAALLVTVLAAMLMLEEKLKRLEYETFMLQ